MSSRKFAAKFAAVSLALALVTCASAGRVRAQQFHTEVVPAETVPPKTAADAERTTHSSLSVDHDSAASVGHHHYISDAARAQDDLLITEVKRALAEDGISQGYAVEVDADHGTVTLSGVVASADDVKAAGDDAADVRGVVAVKNRLRPH